VKSYAFRKNPYGVCGAAASRQASPHLARPRRILPGLAASRQALPGFAEVDVNRLVRVREVSGKMRQSQPPQVIPPPVQTPRSVTLVRSPGKCSSHTREVSGKMGKTGESGFMRGREVSGKMCSVTLVRSPGKWGVSKNIKNLRPNKTCGRLGQIGSTRSLGFRKSCFFVLGFACP